MGRSERSGSRRVVRLPPLGLEGVLDMPPLPARGLILFAHGSGSSRLSPRNNAVAAALGEANLATLLFDLLSTTEEKDRANIFDIDLLAHRLIAATAWVWKSPEISKLPIGYFGASTGAAAALVAAARLGGRIAAVVSRGGRADLVGSVLADVRAPTLLIVGGRDSEVLALNRAALRNLRCHAAIEVVPGATHLFEEPGALDQVVALSRRWFIDHLPIEEKA